MYCERNVCDVRWFAMQGSNSGPPLSLSLSRSGCELATLSVYTVEHAPSPSILCASRHQPDSGNNHREWSDLPHVQILKQDGVERERERARHHLSTLELCPLLRGSCALLGHL
jgi:hypothetical protein